MDKYNGECDYHRCQAITDRICSDYPFVKRSVIGESVLKRRIEMLSIGNNSNGLLVCSAFHGMERITSALALSFFEYVCKRVVKDPQYKDKLNKAGLSVVPMVNPDAVEISTNGTCTAGCREQFVTEILNKNKISHKCWQANANGVDINHNFDAGYDRVKQNERALGITEPSPTRYGGEYPHSENESRAVVSLCENSQFDIAVALHSQGREIYYDFSDKTPRSSFLLALRLSDISGYSVSYPTGVAVGGGFKDYFIDRYRRMAFTIEVGCGKNPLPYTDFYTEKDRVNNMLQYLLEYIMNEKTAV